MKLSELRAAIDAAIDLWGDRPITSRESFFIETPPREVEIHIQEAEIGILAQYMGGMPREWVTLTVTEPRSALAAGLGSPFGAPKQGGKG